MPRAGLSVRCQSLPPLPTSKLGPSGAESQVGGFVYVLGPCGSPTNSPVRLGVSPASSTPTGVFSQKFSGFISPHWDPGLLGLSCSSVVPPGLSICKCGTACSASRHLAWSTSCCLVVSPFCPTVPLQPSYWSG